MDRCRIDGSDSESRLHRVLWLITFLRALALHFMLMAVAVGVWLLLGFDGVYPLASDEINSLRVRAEQYRLEGGALSKGTFFVAAAMLALAVMLFIRWTYRAITQVRPVALRVQAVTLMAVCLVPSLQSAGQLRFAYAELHPGFALLATLALAWSAVLLPLNMALALWHVSRAHERSALLATSDPRLGGGRWRRLARLLDLPRTPLRRPAAAVAFALALAAAIVLVGSATFLLTAGGSIGKLDALVVACAPNPELRQRCAALSADWAARLPSGLVLAAAGIALAAVLRSLARRIGGLGVGDVLRSADDRFVLYLRPFDIDDVVLPRPRLPLLSRLLSLRPFPIRIEEELFDVADGHRPLIAIGRPGRAASGSGGVAYREFLDDDRWQAYALDKIRRAESIVMILKPTDGVRWEFERVVDQEAARRTLFLLDPSMAHTHDWSAVEHMLQPLLECTGVVPQGTQWRFDARPLGFWFRDGTLVEYVNRHWTATSYRTAFSTFLAERVCR